jgi:hypothetical protein
VLVEGARHERTLELLVLDTLGLPFAGYRPEVGPPGGALRGAGDVSDADGRVTITVPCAQAEAEVDVLEPRGLRRRVALTAGSPVRVTLLHDAPDYGRRPGPTLRFSTQLAAPEAGARALASPMRSRRLQKGLDPHVVFSERGLVRPTTAGRVATQQEVAFISDALSSGALQLSLEGGVLTLGDGGRATLKGLLGAVNEVEPLATGSAMAIRGAVFSSEGAVAEGAPVALFADGPQPVARTKCDEQGRYLFEDLGAKPYRVRAGGGAAGVAESEVAVVGGIYDVNLRFALGLTVRGVLRAADGAPIADGRVEWRADDGGWIDEARTRPDGTFVLANLPATSGALLAFAPGAGLRLPAAIQRGVRAGTDDVTLTCAASTSSVQIQTVLPAKLGAPQPRVQVLQVSTGLSQRVARPASPSGSSAAADGPAAAWQLTGLPEGHYEAEVGHACCTTWRSGRLWSDGAAGLDLGVATLAGPGAVRFELPDGPLPEGLAVELIRRRRAHDVRVEVLRRLDEELWVAPGAYRLLWRVGAGEVSRATFAVEADASATLRLQW